MQRLTTGVDWITAIMDLAAMAILVIAGLEFHYKAVPCGGEKELMFPFSH